MKETENVGFIDGSGQVFNLQDRLKFWKFDCDCLVGGGCEAISVSIPSPLARWCCVVGVMPA